MTLSNTAHNARLFLPSTDALGPESQGQGLLIWHFSVLHKASCRNGSALLIGLRVLWAVSFSDGQNSQHQTLHLDLDS